MLFKLIALVVMAHHINACCLPDSFQFTVLTEYHYGSHGPFRSRIIMASDAAQGRAGIFSFSEHGQAFFYADLRSNRAYYYQPSYGCYQTPIDGSIVRNLNETRCAPTHLLNGAPYRMTLAGGVNVTLHTGRVPISHANSSKADVDAVITDRCEPVFFKISGSGFNSISIFSDFHPVPQAGLLELPEACRRVGNATASGRRKRELVNFGFGANPFMI